MELIALTRALGAGSGKTLAIVHLTNTNESLVKSGRLAASSIDDD